MNEPKIVYPRTEADEIAEVRSDIVARHGMWGKVVLGEDGGNRKRVDGIARTADFETLDEIRKYDDNQLAQSLWDRGFPEVAINAILGREED